MSQRADELAARFEQASRDFAAKVEALNERQWQAKTPEEGWTVAATAHHAAGASGPLATMVAAVAGKGPMPPVTQDMLNQLNADHAKQFERCTKEETLALLRETVPQATSVVRGLSDAELAQKAMLPFGMEMSAEQVIEAVLIGHLAGHTKSVTDGAATV